MQKPFHYPWLTLLCILFVTSGYLKAQNLLTYKVTGVVIDHESQSPLSGARISSPNGAILAQAGKTGEFSFSFKHPTQFTVNYVGYTPQTYTVEPEFDLHIEIKLKVQPIEFDTEVITDENIKTVYPKKEIFMYDYGFLDDYFLMTLYDPNTQESRLELMDESRTIIDTKSDFEEPVSAFFRDCLGNIHVLSSNYAYQVNVSEGKLITQKGDIQQFNTVVKPCQGSLDQSVFFKTLQTAHILDYFFFFAKEKAQLLTRIADSTSINLLADEGRMYKKFAQDRPKNFLNISDDEPLPIFTQSTDYKRDTAQSILTPPSINTLAVDADARGRREKRMKEIDKRFMSTVWTPKVFAPLKILNRQVMIFDHPNSVLLKFTAGGTIIDSIPISYHKERAWNREILTDEEGERAFARFGRWGNQRIQQIDLLTGQLTGMEFDIPYEFAQNMKIKGDYLYFIWRTHQNDPVRRLYQLQIR